MWRGTHSVGLLAFFLFLSSRYVSTLGWWRHSKKHTHTRVHQHTTGERRGKEEDDGRWWCELQLLLLLRLLLVCALMYVCLWSFIHLIRVRIHWRRHKYNFIVAAAAAHVISTGVSTAIEMVFISQCVCVNCWCRCGKLLIWSVDEVLQGLSQAMSSPATVSWSSEQRFEEANLDFERGIFW